ncbi:hypothetical protein PM082_004476 [Marasmius tenuissimus]|nr:hypothetical protein PM082_004476 [Marasmius tenuissimus]
MWLKTWYERDRTKHQSFLCTRVDLLSNNFVEAPFRIVPFSINLIVAGVLNCEDWVGDIVEPLRQACSSSLSGSPETKGNSIPYLYMAAFWNLSLAHGIYRVATSSKDGENLTMPCFLVHRFPFGSSDRSIRGLADDYWGQPSINRLPKANISISSSNSIQVGARVRISNCQFKTIVESKTSAELADVSEE